MIGGALTMVMTVGGLSRCTGVPVKTLREYEDMGLIYTVGRKAGKIGCSTRRRSGASG